ncbi:hypothetical protein [Streptomyces cellulosae]|uniref:hypothetical protein n=1 Tax=Streptomyces cellulosae TaxID=1968 RepID=UPI0004C92374|nr:hypothetical protein [Streptomyces cellulosae]
MDDSLSFESFYEGAKEAAHKAMDDHGRAEYDWFALHAGVAIERLAKAVLVSKNPIYIAELRNADMMLYLGGHLTLKDVGKVRTVGANDAITRLRKIKVLEADTRLDLLIELRNGVAHASSDSREGKGMISPLTRTIETLLNDLGKPLSAFWGRWTEAIMAAVNEQEDQLFRDIQLRIAQARHSIQDRFEGLPAAVRKRALKAPPRPNYEGPGSLVEFTMEGHVVFSTINGGCAACGGQARVAFKPVELAHDKSTYIANSISCSLCMFEVSGPEELAAVRSIVEPESIPKGSIIPFTMELRKKTAD